jgi:hypothetical protein
VALRVVAVVCLFAGPAHAWQDHPPGPPQTDRTVAVSRGTRLTLDNFAGEVTVHAWARDAVRVQARHGSRTTVMIRPGPSSLAIGAEAANGPSGSVDYDISVPAWLPLRIDGPYNDVTVEGGQADIAIDTVRGDITIKGGSGAVTAKTIEGEVVVQGTRGSLNVSSVNEDLKITGAGGQIVAETTNGSITLAHMESTGVDVSTINGDVSYDGTLAARGHYRITTHNGDIALAVPETANATVTVRTYEGELKTSLPARGPDRAALRRGKEVTYVLGDGSADVELESFGGTIELRRSGDSRTGRSR